ncbi:hypothetical protein TCAL_00894 [Tigriopus californicus]|uniref:Ribosomal protein L9 domain-containing protein n=1 Tax=Tigriopus californicus TaxID=6832 RepID=A0A553P6I7_TIGCA|nr:large ribosomal subunit protein bL9m-like [Tigriopus californicus]TRY73291.1 hypothetical protein TCAL_00894 [Tigriopus californicus]|eukprot:TCALIF_00894-PA protein Name:"Similar to mRpL9 39S ribosomal protein L9, mitochondrial (Drosophila melanogaster)" AED:0.06 eAED:0.06 QI:0/-1/0/1/-1/1/1/0/295
MLASATARTLSRWSRPACSVSSRSYWKLTRTSLPPRHPAERPTAEQLNEQSENFHQKDMIFRAERVKQPGLPVQVLMLTDVLGYGPRGQILTVRNPNIARQELILPGLAVYARPENIADFGPGVIPEDQLVMSTVRGRATMRTLLHTPLPLSLHHENPWTVTPEIVHCAFRRIQFQVPIEVIELPDTPISGPDPDKQGKEFLIHVTINGVERVPVRVVIHHLNPEDAKANRELGWQHRFREPLFEEQREALAMLPRPPISQKTAEKEGFRPILTQYQQWAERRQARLRSLIPPES